jgi:ABC-type Fe3+-siderophore transport system permease subunit
LLTAASTLLVGPLSLVGLMAPHIARSLGVCRAREQLFASAAVGALLMVLAQWCGNLLLFPNEMPAGLMAALIGGPYLLWSLLRVGPRAA